ncbi:MAG: response regulator, partial [Pseudomonadota bacterium]
MNARVLFVDDEPRVLQGLENLLFDAPDDWELEFVESGAAAVEKLKSESYEVLVTDMRMPGMDGAELLDRARQISPSMVRIVLSGHTEQEAAERAIVLAHEFLSKPCETDKLIETLDWAFTLGAATAPTLRKAVGALVSLPARPDVHRRLNEMAQSDANIDTLAELIASDVAMTAQLLHVASSAFYGLGAVNDLKQAINVMGLETTCALVLSIETLRAFEVPDWFDLEYLHADCTRITALTAELVDKELQPQAVMASMLHDVGHMVIATCF